MYLLHMEKQLLESLFADLYTLTGSRITLFNHLDNNYCKAYLAVKSEMSEFCRIVRSDENARKKCQENDLTACDICSKQKKLHLYKCHLGLTEAIFPIEIEGKLLGYLMFGQVIQSEPNPEMWENIKKSCIDYKFDLDQLEKAYYQLSHLSIEKTNAAAKIMEMSAKYIVLSSLVKVKYEPLPQRIKEFLEVNADKNISISDLSEKMNKSKSYLSHIIKAEFNVSFTEYLLNIRLKNAISLLENSEMSIEEIALTVGFEDPNYFSRIFKKKYGYSPSKFRMMTFTE